MKTLYKVALSMLPRMGLGTARPLMKYLQGDLSLLFEGKFSTLEKDWASRFEDSHLVLPERILADLRSGDALRRAEKELAFAEKYHLKICFYEDADYPSRLKACADVPLLFYMKGDVDLEAGKILSVVGTRKMTTYGRCQTEDLIASLAGVFPDLLIVSGLAYGVDVCAHRKALACGLPTLAVVAHGLDSVYPSQHRAVAREMISSGGGMLSEFPSGTEPYRSNFVQRNRIVAGLCDACLVIESPEKGGSLITARMARDYDREVFALPGRPVDANSRGCNLIIKQQVATLVESAEDIVREMNWDLPSAKAGGGRKAGGRADSSIGSGKFNSAGGGKFSSAGGGKFSSTGCGSLFAGQEFCARTGQELCARTGQGLSAEEATLFSLMQPDKKYGAQDLLELSLAQHQESCARNIGEVLSVLLLLEMKQAVISLPGGLYQRRPGY